MLRALLTSKPKEIKDAEFEDAMAKEEENEVKKELGKASNHIRSAASHAASSLSHAMEEGKAGLKAEMAERQRKAELERKEALADSYRTADFHSLTNHYHQLFQVKPFVNRFSIQTPNIINTSGLNYSGWKLLPTLNFGINASQSLQKSITENVTINSSLEAINEEISSTTNAMIGAPVSNPTNAFIDYSTQIKNSSTGMGFEEYSTFEKNYATVGIRMRSGPRSPSIGFNWQMTNNINTGNNHQFALDASYCFYRNTASDEALTAGIQGTTKVVPSCKYIDHRSLQSISAAFRYSIQNEQINKNVNQNAAAVTLSGLIKIDPYNANIQQGKMQICRTQRTSENEFPQYSVGMMGGILGVSYSPLNDRLIDRLAKVDFDSEATFSIPSNTKPVLLFDILYRPDSLIRYQARMTSDLALSLIYQQRLQKNFLVHASLTTGLKGINGEAEEQQNISPSIIASKVAIGLTIDG